MAIYTGEIYEPFDSYEEADDYLVNGGMIEVDVGLPQTITYTLIGGVLHYQDRYKSIDWKKSNAGLRAYSLIDITGIGDKDGNCFYSVTQPDPSISTAISVPNLPKETNWMDEALILLESECTP